MSRTLTLFVVAAALVTACSPVLGADRSWSEDFETQTVGVHPGPNAPPAPYWTGHVPVPPYSTAEVMEAGWGNPTKFYGVDAYAQGSTYGSLSSWIIASGTDAHPEELVFEFDMMVREDAAGRGPQISLVDAEAGSYFVAGMLWNNGTGQVTIVDAGGPNDLSFGDGVSEEWSHYRLTVDTIASTITAQQDDNTPVTTTYTPESAAKPTPDGVRIYGRVPKYIRRYFLDNLEIQEGIPLPPSLGTVLVVR